MGLAIEQAKLAATQGEVPVGAVLVVNEELIASAYNQVEALQDPTAHAETLVIREASKRLSSWRLSDAKLYVTLEPCPMCLGAMLLSRIDSLFFAARDKRLGAAGSQFDISAMSSLPHQLKTYSGLLEDESKELLGDFFSALRDN